VFTLSASLALLVGAAFVALVLSLGNVRSAQRETRHNEKSLTAIAATEKSILDMETGLRGFLVTGEDRFLEPYRLGRAHFPVEAAELVASERGDPPDLKLAQRIAAGGSEYLHQYAEPLLVNAGSRLMSRQRLIRATAEGNRRVDVLRRMFTTLVRYDRAASIRANADADQAGTQALVLGIIGLVGVLLLTAAFAFYMARSVTRPIRLVSDAAKRLREGETAAEVPMVSGTKEVTELAQSFNAMAGALETSRRALLTERDVLDERVQERTAELRDSRLEALQRLALAAEYRDDDTHQHTERVGRVSALIAQTLGLDSDTVELIRIGAPLHDVGKIGVPDSILLKPGRLTAAEFEAMKTHVTVGEAILSSTDSELFRMAAEIARFHHERWDGAGYDAGLAGDAIPLAARIVNVADTFDALTHDRPYKRAWPLGAALEEIRTSAGGQFDPAVVAAFEQLDHARLLDSDGRLDSARRARPISDDTERGSGIPMDQALVRAAFENTPNAVLVMDDERRCMEVNNAACQLFGLARDELLARRLDDFTAPVTRTRLDGLWADFLAGGTDRARIELLIDGQPITVEYSVSANVLPGRHLSVLHRV
jgi:PAS domain S-box-containing protein